MQPPDSRGNPNVQAPRYLLGSSAGMCRRCGAPIELFAFAVLPGHWVLEPDDPAFGVPASAVGALAAETWRVAGSAAILFHVEWVTTEVARRVLDIAPTFQPTGSFEAPDSSDADACGWCNHCGHCGSPQPDDVLHCEPGGAFLPFTADDARIIHWLPIDTPFGGFAAGYSPDPPFFDAPG